MAAVKSKQLGEEKKRAYHRPDVNLLGKLDQVQAGVSGIHYDGPTALRLHVRM